MNVVWRALLFALVRFLIGAHPRWLGCAPTAQQRIYFSNHSSHLDTLALLAALPPGLRALTRPVAAKDYWNATRFTRFLAKDCLRAILVERHPKPGIDPLAPLIEALEDGDSLILYPEGTRGDGPPGPFKPGLYHLAKRFPQADLVPVYLDTLNRALPKGAFVIVPFLCTPSFGQPLRLTQGEGKPDFLARAQEAVRRLGPNDKEPPT
jgi:1-acyl-sn-glycerol-3-phosphate acyltransferase